MKSLFRSTLILAGAFTLTTSLPAQPAPPPLPAETASPATGIGPKIEFSTENYDSGKTIVGEPVNCTFQVTNAGDAMLELSQVHGSCSCTAVSWDRNIAPHMTGKILAVVQTHSAGAIEKTVTVTSNDPHRANVVLHIHGMVWLPIEVSPGPSVTFSLMPGGAAPPSQTLHIFNRTEQPLTLSQPVISSNVFSAMLKTNVPGQEYELTVSVAVPSKLPAAQGTINLSGTITIKTSSDKMSILNIAAMAVVYPEIMIAPGQIQLPHGPFAQAMPVWLSIRDNTGRGLTVSDPMINVPGVDVAVKVLTTNRNYGVEVTFPQGYEQRPGENVAVTVKTDNPHYPTISVPVIALMNAVPPRPMMLAPAAAVPSRIHMLTNGQARPVIPSPVSASLPQP